MHKQENMIMLVHAFFCGNFDCKEHSFKYILETGKVTTGNRDAHFTIHISKEMVLQRCLQHHMRDAVALVIISP